MNGNSLLLVPGTADGDEENLAGLFRKETDDIKVITNPSRSLSNQVSPFSIVPVSDNRSGEWNTQIPAGSIVSVVDQAMVEAKAAADERELLIHDIL